MRRVLSLSAVLLLLWVGLALAADEVICIVDTDPAAEADYHSLADAIAGETGASPKCVKSADLVANDEQLTIELRASGAHAADGETVISGFTLNDDCYLKLYVPPSHRHAGEWDDTKYRIVTDGAPITIQQRHWVIDGVQLSNTNSTSGSRTNLHHAQGSGSVANMTIRNVISKMVGAGANRRVHFGHGSTGNAGSTLKIENCILIGGDHGVGINDTEDADLSTSIYNCTISGMSTGIYQSAGVVTVTNCAVFNNTDDFNGTMTVTYTASDDNDISGTGNVDISPGATEADDWAAAFNDYANGDFSLKSGSPLIDAGIGPALDSDVPTTDIVGNARSGNTCCIGAFEYVVSSIPVAMHHYNLLRSA